jgi:hypothetical protein
MDRTPGERQSSNCWSCVRREIDGTFTLAIHPGRTPLGDSWIGSPMGARIPERTQSEESTMAIPRVTLRVVGVLAILIGLVWVGQGTGYFPYPASSFMIDQMPWAYRGAGLAALGVLAVLASRRM